MIGKEGSVSMDDLKGINGLNDEVLPPDFNEESESESLSDNVKIISPTRLVLKRFFRSKLSVVGLCIMIGLLLFCAETFFSNRNQGCNNLKDIVSNHLK